MTDESKRVIVWCFCAVVGRRGVVTESGKLSRGNSVTAVVCVPLETFGTEAAGRRQESTSKQGMDHFGLSLREVASFISKARCFVAQKSTASSIWSFS